MIIKKNFWFFIIAAMLCVSLHGFFYQDIYAAQEQDLYFEQTIQDLEREILDARRSGRFDAEAESNDHEHYPTFEEEGILFFSEDVHLQDADILDSQGVVIEENQIQKRSHESIIVSSIQSSDKKIEWENRSVPSLAALSSNSQRLTIDFRDSDLEKVFRLFSESSGINFLLEPALRNVPVTMHLKDVTLQEAIELIFSAYNLKHAQIGGSIFVATLDRINTMDSLTKIIRLRNIRAENAERLLANVVQSLSFDREANIVVITGAPHQIDQALRIIDKADQPQRQVLLTAQILEVSHDFDRELGIDWSNSTSIGVRETGRPDEVSGMMYNAPTPFRIFRLARSSIDFDLSIKHMLSTGKARILANPQIATVTGREANIFIGDRIPYEVTLVSGGQSNTEVRFTEAGIKLSITPSVIEDDYVIVEVAPEVSFIPGYRGADNQYPIVSTREAKASMRVYNGETFILGGLLSEEEKVDLFQVPLLGSLPLLGKLFQYEKRGTAKKEIIITVTPEIIVR